MKLFNVLFYSSGSAAIDVERAHLNNVKLSGWVSQPMLIDIYKSADCFISIAERKGKQISSKIFEYMSYGKPIIHIYFSDEDRNVQYLKSYPNAFCLKVNENDIEKDRCLVKQFIRCRRNIQVISLNESILKKCTPIYISNLLTSEID